ncbi:MAG: hypothetical protein IPL84_11020 [Chitinophagaceae bacterium]|nr:hypothetical protein [Chitinophagaceae bacterium]
MEDKLDEFNTDAGCPKCGSKIITKVKYTWWGGVLGPRLLHHTKCETCNYRFNGKTGKSNTPGIIIYSVLIFVVLFVIFYFIKTM